jgi:hypothetical protein
VGVGLAGAGAADEPGPRVVIVDAVSDPFPVTVDLSAELLLHAVAYAITTKTNRIEVGFMSHVPSTMHAVSRDQQDDRAIPIARPNRYLEHAH